MGCVSSTATVGRISHQCQAGKRYRLVPQVARYLPESLDMSITLHGMAVLVPPSGRGRKWHSDLTSRSSLVALSIVAALALATVSLLLTEKVPVPATLIYIEAPALRAPLVYATVFFRHTMQERYERARTAALTVSTASITTLLPPKRLAPSAPSAQCRRGRQAPPPALLQQPSSNKLCLSLPLLQWPQRTPRLRNAAGAQRGAVRAPAQRA